MKEQLKGTLFSLAESLNIPIDSIRVGIEKENGTITYHLWNRSKKIKVITISDIVENKIIIPFVKSKINNIFKDISKKYNGNIIEIRLYIKNEDLKGNIVIDYVPTANFDFEKYL